MSFRVALWCLGLVSACGKSSDDDTPVDADGDGYLSDSDCDDSDPAINPSAQEICNNVDDDCDGEIDIEDPDVEGTSSWPVDADGDGFGDPTLSADGCEQPAGTADNTEDCDDRNRDIFPGAVEICDGIDNDCDGATDAEDDDPTGVSYWAPDLDGDGYGDSSQAAYGCEPPEPGWINNANDCDDDEASVYPGAAEVCGDGVDGDCDGLDGPAAYAGSGSLACAQAWWDGAAGVSALGQEVTTVGDVNGDGSTDLGMVSAGGVWLMTEVVTGGATSDDAAVNVFPSGPAAGLAAGPLLEGSGYGLVVADGEAGLAWVLGTSTGRGSTDLDSGVGVLPIESVLNSAALTGSVAVLGDATGASVAGLLVGEQDGASLFLAPLASSLQSGDAALRFETGEPVVVSSIGPRSASESDVGLLGMPTADQGAGAVSVLYETQVVATLSGVDGEAAGAAVGAAGDWNGDGVGDLIVGAPLSDEEAAGAGRVYIVSGDTSADGLLPDIAMADLTGREAGQQAGASVSGGGDINGDGFSDLVVGAPGTDEGRGAILVVLGPVEGTASLGDVAYTELGESEGAAAGAAVNMIGDVDGDGLTEMVAGAPAELSGRGSVYLFFGGPL